MNIPSKVKEARLVSLNWKILSNIYPTNILLHKMGKASSSNCTTCNKKDYLEHFFYQCKKINILWDEASVIISNQIGRPITLSVTDILFGYYNDSNVNNLYINSIIMIGKMCISKYKYGNHPNLLFLFHHDLEIRSIEF